MKINKAILAAALGLTAVGIAHATDEVYITGSTAARAAVYATLANPGSVFSSAPVITGYGAAGASDSYVAFYGILNGNTTPTIINAHWSGSEAGITDVGTPTATEAFIADSLISSSASSDTAGSPSSTQTHAVDLALADNAQAFSPAGKNLDGGALTGDEVGVVPFKWVRNPGVWTGNNVSDSQIRQTIGGIGAKLAVFTGNAADVNNYVYVAGRDASSGTRVNALGESGYGINTPPNQIELSGGLQQVEATSHGHNTYIGNFGQASGGTLAASLGVSTVSSPDQVHAGLTGFGAIGYLGVSDSATAVADGATVLNYDGVPYSVGAVEEGTYSFWGNEYVYQNPGYTGESASYLSIYSSLINTTTGVSAQADNNIVISLSALHTSRTGPTSDPAHN